MGLFSSSKSSTSNQTNNDNRQNQLNTQSNTAPVFNLPTGDGSSAHVNYTVTDGGAVSNSLYLARVASDNVAAVAGAANANMAGLAGKATGDMRGLSESLLSSSERMAKNVMQANTDTLQTGFEFAGKFLDTVQDSKSEFMDFAKGNVATVTDAMRSAMTMAADIAKPDQGQTKELLTVMAYAAVAIVGLIAFGKR